MPQTKFLVVRLSSAGDVVLTSPLLKVLRDRNPDSEIHFVVKARYADIVIPNPNVNRVHLVQEDAGTKELKALRSLLRAEKFDTILDLQNNFRSIYLRKGISSDLRVVRKDVFKRALLVRTKWNFFKTIRPVSLKYVQTYDEAITSVDQPELYVPKGSIDAADSLWSANHVESRRTLALCPGARHFTKRWPVEYWRKIASGLAQEFQIVLLGGTEDSEICRDIADSCGGVDYSGKLSLMESAAMLRHADVVVTNDSFLMHAADALGKKLIAVFGSSVKEFGFYPCNPNARVLEVNGLNCRPCSHVGREACPKSHFKCMLEITPDSVARSIREMTIAAAE